ncbi:translation elongation factor Ts [bacterium]|nr:translation elongation factor Ts [bacterium]
MAITAAQIKELRDLTSAGMMDCKEALKECEGDVKKAQEWLRRKGMAKADKKASRTTGEGRIGCYMHHNGKVGVFVELHCETDFVAKTEDFEHLLNDLCLQVASMSPKYVSREQIDKAVIEKELASYRQNAIDSGKPEAIAEKIAQGQVDKYFKEMCLLDQAFIKDETITVEQLIKQTIGKLGENITVERFVRMEVGVE